MSCRPSPSVNVLKLDSSGNHTRTSSGLGSLLYFSTGSLLQSKKVLGKSNKVQVKSTLLENYLSKKYSAEKVLFRYKVLFNNWLQKQTPNLAYD